MVGPSACKNAGCNTRDEHAVHRVATGDRQAARYRRDD